MLARIGALWMLALAVLPASAEPQGAPTRAAVTTDIPTNADAAFKALRDSARTRPLNAPLQYRLGLLAWALAEQNHDARPGALRADASRMGQIAADALRKAIAAAPDSARYRVAFIRFSTAMELPSAGVTFRVALASAKAAADSALIADAAMEYGRYYWRLYDGMANRAVRLVSDPARSVSDAMNPMGRAAEAIREGSALSVEEAERLLNYRESTDRAKSIDSRMASLIEPRQDLEDGMLPFRYFLREARDYLHRIAIAPTPGESGEGAYIRAEELFREAYAAQPHSEYAFHQFAMLLAERSRWGELAALAEHHTAAVPADPMGWLALGLGAHRVARHATAEAAFDTALSRMDLDERKRID